MGFRSKVLKIPSFRCGSVNSSHWKQLYACGCGNPYLLVELQSCVELFVLVVEVALGFDVVEDEEGVAEVGIAYFVDALMMDESVLKVYWVLRELLSFGQILCSGLLTSVVEDELVSRLVAKIVAELEGFVTGLDQLY